MTGVAMMDDVGALSDVAAISITATATSHTITAGKRGVILQNLGSKPVFVGGSTVDADNNRGIKILPNQIYQFRNCKSDFKAYLVCATGESSTIGVVEYD